MYAGKALPDQGTIRTVPGATSAVCKQLCDAAAPECAQVVFNVAGKTCTLKKAGGAMTAKGGSQVFVAKGWHPTTRPATPRPTTRPTTRPAPTPTKLKTSAPATSPPPRLTTLPATKPTTKRATPKPTTKRATPKPTTKRPGAYDAHPGVAYAGDKGDLATLHGSPAQCVTKCDATKGCVQFVYDTADKFCFLKKALPNTVPHKQAHKVLYVKHGQPSWKPATQPPPKTQRAYSKQDRVDLPSAGTLATLTKVSVTDCKAACDKRKGCVQFVYEPQKDRCWLKPQLAGCTPAKCPAARYNSTTVLYRQGPPIVAPTKKPDGTPVPTTAPPPTAGPGCGCGRPGCGCGAGAGGCGRPGGGCGGPGGGCGGCGGQQCGCRKRRRPRPSCAWNASTVAPDAAAACAARGGAIVGDTCVLSDGQVCRRTETFGEETFGEEPAPWVTLRPPAARRRRAWTLPPGAMPALVAALAVLLFLSHRAR